MTAHAGAVIADRFEIEVKAGTGGMGAVYRARDLHTGETVALKLMQVLGDEGKDTTLTTRFIRESQVLADLHHPGIVKYVHHGILRNGTPYLAMEWLEGEDLSQRLRRKGVSQGEALTIIRGAAEALVAAHSRGIIHRDLKPSNLFLRDCKADKVVVLDFGLARRMWQETTRYTTRTGVVLGTPEYMAPEQARGAHEVGPAADVFSLGCLLFQCLTGKPPFVAEHVTALLAKILFDEPPRLRAVRPEMPEALERLLAKMLDKRAAKRLQDAKELLEAMDAMEELSDVSSLDRAPGITSRPSLLNTEQSLVSLVIAAEPMSSNELPTVQFEEEPVSKVQYEVLIERVMNFGARLERLADGSLVATLEQTSHSAATDQAAQAARCALYLKEQHPESRVVLVTGRGVISESLPMGEALDRAAQLLRSRTAALGAVAKSDEGVWIDEVTSGLLGPSFRTTRVAPKVAALHSEVLDVDESRVLMGKPTPCVGREHELSLLESTLSFISSECVARALLIVAEPGMGKSRLRHEFLRRLSSRGEDVTVLSGRSDPISAGSSYGLLNQALRKYCNVNEGDPSETRRANLLQGVSRHVPLESAPRVAAFLGEMCSLPFPDATDVKLRAARNDPKIMSDQISHAWLDFLRAECEHQPVLLVLEDLHWGDALTVKLVDLALRELEESPLLVLALARPEVADLFPSLWAGKVQEIPLTGLSRRASEKLVEQVLGKDAPRDWVKRIVAQAAGNALYLEELIRALAEDSGEELPPTVLAMLQARVARLEPGARRVLRVASIFGETFWRGGLIALQGEEGKHTATDSWLDYLVKAEIIRQREDSRYPSEPEYMFRHGLVRDAAYSLLTEEDRVLGHRLAGEFLESVGEGEPMVLAEHFQRGDEPTRAVPYFVRGAIQALDGSDVESALARVARGQASGAAGADLGILLGVQAWGQFWKARISDAYPVGVEALKLLTPGSRQWCRTIGVVFMTGGLIGKFPELGEWIRLFATVDPDPDARTPYTEAGAILATVFSMVGRRQEAYQFLARVDAIGGLVADADAKARGWMCHAHNWHIRFLEPDPWGAYRTAVDGTQAFIEAGDRRMFAVEDIYLGIAHWDLGNLELGLKTLREAMALGQELQEVLVVRLARIYIALFLMERGDPATFDEVHELAMVVVNGTPGTYYAGLAHCAVAQEQAARGLLDEAEEHARKAADTLKVTPPLHALGYAVLGRVLMTKGRAAEAREVTDTGLALVDRLGGAGRKELKLRLCAAEVRHACGDMDGAAEALREARKQLDLRAGTIADEAIRARFLSQVPDHARILELCRAWLGE